MSLGNRALGIMGMIGLSGLADKDEEQTAPREGGSGMGMGLGNVMTSMSNSLFEGMSQEQVYKMGQSFNTLRFEPDDRMAANFEARLNAMDKEKSATAARTNAVNALLNMKSDEYPNGRTDLAALVKQGVMPGADAIKEAIKKTKPSALQEKLAIFSDPANPYGLTETQKTLGINNALGVAVTKSDLQNKLDIYKKMRDDNT